MRDMAQETCETEEEIKARHQCSISVTLIVACRNPSIECLTFACVWVTCHGFARVCVALHTFGTGQMYSD